MGKREHYIGSVRFFRHLILAVTGLLIVVPIAVCILLTADNRKLSAEIRRLREEKGEIEKELEELNRQVSELAKAESLDAVKEKAFVSAASGQEKWKLLLVNEMHPLEEDFKTELTAVPGGQQVDSRIAEPLSEMMEAMRREGMAPLVCSGYRSIEKQSRLFQEFIEDKLRDGWSYEKAFYKAKTRIALPGTSEHHTGLAVDIVGKSYQSLDDGQQETSEARWLAAHCAEYGFILRYPKGKTDITGIDYESWHFRYVGEEAAAYIMENEITLEEFLETVDKL